MVVKEDEWWSGPFKAKTLQLAMSAVRARVYMQIIAIVYSNPIAVHLKIELPL